MTEDQIIDVIAEHLAVGRERVTRDADFADDLGADSLDMLELQMAFEHKIDREIPDDDVVNAKTVGQAIEYLLR